VKENNINKTIIIIRILFGYLDLRNIELQYSPANRVAERASEAEESTVERE